MIYWSILKIRNAFYRKGSKHVKKAEVPTICIGNITVGGTGKTPHTEMLLRTLQSSDEWAFRNIAVLSRGYKRRSRGFQQVTMDGSAKVCGDEPLQVKRKFPAVTVAVDKNRIEGCDFLVHPEKLGTSRKARKCLHKEMPAAELVVLDDAYQYRKLAADLNIVLVDWNRPTSKDHLMPWGRLRDLKKRLFDADIVIVSKCPSYLEDSDREEFAKVLGYDSYDPLTRHATHKDVPQPLLFTTVKYGHSVPMYETSNPRYIYSKQLVLFSGIANDTPLRNYLSDSYRIVRHLDFPDHHIYTSADIAKICGAIKHHAIAAVATTEKDAMRIMDYAGMPEVLRERMFMVPIEVDFMDDLEREIFRAKVLSI